MSLTKTKFAAFTRLIDQLNGRVCTCGASLSALLADAIFAIKTLTLTVEKLEKDCEDLKAENLLMRNAVKLALNTMDGKFAYGEWLKVVDSLSELELTA